MEHYHRFYEQYAPFFVSMDDSPEEGMALCQSSYEIIPELGQGWMDMHEFGNGVMTSRMDWRLAHELQTQYDDFPDSIYLGLLGYGKTQFRFGQSSMFDCQPGDIFLRNGDPGICHNNALGECTLGGVSIDIPRGMIDLLDEQGLDMRVIGQRNSYQVFKASEHMMAELRQATVRMLTLRTTGSLLARIELESLSLDILLKLIGACANVDALTERKMPKRWLVALDDAMDILHAEWSQPLTIAQLARRAGINECYLKSLFRERNGMGVAAYMRQLRMRHAHEMIQSGRYTIQQTAAMCGYANPGKFAQAFRREYGVSPSSLG